MAASAWSTTTARALDVLSDERLARIASRGDQRAFDALFARHHGGLTRYCRTILRHAADAEDAAQNALVAAHRAVQAGTVPMRVKPWLYKIAHNEAITLVRTRKPAEELDEARLPLVADAEEAGEVRRRLGQLMSDLRALTDRQREALVLRELCGLEYAEIAQTLGTTEAAAHQTVFEARSALQQFGEGRALDCEGVQRALSDCDGMRLRTRTVRAHLRGCARCRSFESSLRARRRDLGLLFPPTGVAGGIAAALARLLGGGGEPLIAGLGLKGAALGLAVLAGGGTVVATSVGGDDPPRPPAAALPVAAVSAPAVTTGADAGATPPSAAVSAPARRTARRGALVRRRPGRARPQTASAGAPGAPVAAGTPDRSAPAVAGAATSGAGAEPRSGDGGGAGGEDAGGSPSTGRPPAPVRDVVTSAGQTVQQATQVLGDTVQDTVDQAGGAVQGTVDEVGATVDDVVEVVTGGVGGLLGGPQRRPLP